MDGRAIGSVALADAGPRALASEYGGPRPAGVRVEARAVAAAEARAVRVTRP